MAKEDTTKTILIIGGLALGAYILTRPGIKEKVSEGLAGYFPQISFAPIDLALPETFGLEGLMDQLKECAGGSCLPGALIPELNLPGGDLLGGLDEIVNKLSGKDSATGPAEHATWVDVAYSLPAWAKAGIGVGATALAGYGGYQVIRAFTPTLRAAGTATAHAIGGAGTVLRNLLTRQVATKVSGNVIKAVPVATKAAGGGILGGLLPAIAFTGIVEGAYQIFRTIRGEENIGLTGVPPIDIINLIRGKSALFTTNWPVPSLLFGGGPAGAAQELAAQGGTPITVAPTMALVPSAVATHTTAEMQFPSYPAAEQKKVSITAVGEAEQKKWAGVAKAGVRIW